MTKNKAIQIRARERITKTTTTATKKSIDITNDLNAQKQISQFMGVTKSNKQVIYAIVFVLNAIYCFEFNKKNTCTARTR